MRVQTDKTIKEWLSKSLDQINLFITQKEKDIKDGRNPRLVIATEIGNEENIKEYKSTYATQKDLGINTGLIKMCCEGTNRVKCGISKVDGKKYRFEYA